MIIILGYRIYLDNENMLKPYVDVLVSTRIWKTGKNITITTENLEKNVNSQLLLKPQKDEVTGQPTNLRWK